ncbi:hypothetical protein DFP73DRAFT_529241 [Morchella snyderi]|nr:hypothetical protein DFP73DRAFT_529241 [Morchella snyderi]
MNIGWFSKFNFEHTHRPNILPTNGGAADRQLNTSLTEEASVTSRTSSEYIKEKAKIYGFTAIFMLVLCVITAVVARAVLADAGEASYTIMMDSINDIDGKTMEPYRGGVGFGHDNAQATELMTTVLPASTAALSLDQDTTAGTLTVGTQVFVLVDSTITAQPLTGTDLYAPILTDPYDVQNLYATPTGTPQYKARKRSCTTDKNTVEAGHGPCTLFSVEPGVGKQC